METLKLYFEGDTNQSSYKIGVRVYAPNEVTGCEETVYRRVFDENTWFQVCENAFKKEVKEYFRESSHA